MGAFWKCNWGKGEEREADSERQVVLESGDLWLTPALDYTTLGCRICEVTTTHSVRRPNEVVLHPLINGKCINPPGAFLFVYGVLELRIKDFKRHLVLPSA